MKLAFVFLLYSIADFTGMLWMGYHPLVTIASFWLSLVLFYAIASHHQGKWHVRRYRRKVMREVR